MLVDKKSTKTAVMTFKLVTGEEIIGTNLEHIQSNTVRIKRPLAMVLADMPGAPHQTQVVFTPWMLALSEDEEVVIEKRHIIHFGKARKDAADQYESATRSNDPA